MTSSIHKAVIFGATSAIGFAIAESLAAQKTQLVLAGRSTEKLAASQQALLSDAVSVETIRADLSTSQGIKRCCEDLAVYQQDVDCVVYAAGDIVLEKVMVTSDDTYDRLMNVNLKAPFFTVKALIPALIKSRGQIVFVNSSVTLNGARGNLSVYAAGKFGLRALADSLRGELNAHGVRVLSIYPGRTASAMQEKIFQSEQKNYVPDDLLQPEDIAESVLSALLLPPTAEVTDIAIRPSLAG